MKGTYKPLILVINPGSTSTKVAIFEEDSILFEKSCNHSAEDLGQFKHILEQQEFRYQAVLEFLEETKVPINRIKAVIGRGGMLKPISGGTYLVNGAMLDDLKNASKEHASNLGGLIAKKISENLGVPAYIADPIVVDEMEQIAKVSGLQGVERISIFHALNQKATARKAASQMGHKYTNCNLIVVHLGGGISVGAHQQGRVIDVNNALDGDGPFSPERAGSIPMGSAVEMCFQPGITKSTIQKNLVGKGGLVSYFGTNDGREIEKRINEGDDKARLIYEAMAYQVAKEIGACAAVLRGKIDAIVITGGIAYSKMMVQWIIDRVGFLAPILVLPGENEMEALALSALRVLKGEEKAKAYENGD